MHGPKTTLKLLVHVHAITPTHLSKWFFEIERPEPLSVLSCFILTYYHNIDNLHALLKLSEFIYAKFSNEVHGQIDLLGLNGFQMTFIFP